MRGLMRISRPVLWRDLVTIVIGIVRIAASLGFVWICKRLVDIVTGVVDADLSEHVWILIGIMLVQLACGIASNYWGAYNIVKTQNDMRLSFFSHVLGSRWNGREAFRSGDTVNRLEEDVRILADLICMRLPDVVLTVIQLIAASVFMLTMAPSLLWLLILLMVVAVVGSKMYFKKIREINSLIRSEDSEVQIELATMGVEAKNKAAITMLATGLYMSSGNKAGFKANNALNSFLESQIQGIAGDALKTIDISIGVEGNTTATGETQTDYTFQFSKKFWNDRVTFVIGGKVTTGAEDNTSSSQSFIDNISLEYRLNRFGTRYIQVFYDNDTHDPFEGNYSSAGAGYIWRSKTQHFGDLLLFKRKKKVAKQIKEAETQESENEN